MEDAWADALEIRVEKVYATIEGDTRARDPTPLPATAFRSESSTPLRGANEVCCRAWFPSCLINT